MVRYAAALGEEHGGRLTLDLWVLNLPKPERVTTPLLVLGAELDACVTEAETQRTARAYRTEAEVFPNMGHNMMLEPGWQAVAARIDGWLTDRGLSERPVSSGAVSELTFLASQLSRQCLHAHSVGRAQPINLHQHSGRASLTG